MGVGYFIDGVESTNFDVVHIAEYKTIRQSLSGHLNCPVHLSGNLAHFEGKYAKRVGSVATIALAMPSHAVDAMMDHFWADVGDVLAEVELACPMELNSRRFPRPYEDVVHQTRR